MKERESEHFQVKHTVAFIISTFWNQGLLAITLCENSQIVHFTHKSNPTKHHIYIGSINSGHGLMSKAGPDLGRPNLDVNMMFNVWALDWVIFLDIMCLWQVQEMYIIYTFFKIIF